jgi:hypothetical protein
MDGWMDGGQRHLPFFQITLVIKIDLDFIRIDNLITNVI